MRYFSFTDGKLPLGDKTYIMGILNVTPDSFSDGNKWYDPDDAVRHAVQMEKDGADIIDIGAFSTRPGAAEVSPAEEWRRLSAVLPTVIKEVKVPISVDTFVPFVAEKCLSLGVQIVNDVSGTFNADTARLVKESGAGWIMMHGGVATGKTESEVEYKNGITADVSLFFDKMSENAEKFGIEAAKICLDPGFGFSKNSEQNIELLKNLSRVDTHGHALLSALSRKRFVGTLCGETNADKRDEATLTCNLMSTMNGADIIRVHNVALHKKAFAAFDALKNNR